MAPFDDIAHKNLGDKRKAFSREFVDAAADVISFVDKRLGWDGAGVFEGALGGSFNFALKIAREGSDEVVVARFPSAGVYGPWRDEKVKNEVMAMKYISEHTSVPVPKVRFWGLTEESPHRLGPFIVMDFMPGECLGTFIAQPTEDVMETIFLDPDVDDAKLDVIYEQVAGFMLELSRLEFPRIGGIAQDAASGEWTVTERPLTYDMNELVTLGGCPVEQFDSTGPFDRARDYFSALAKHFQSHLDAQRNIAGSDKDLAWEQFVARRCYEKLVPTYGTIDDDGPFRLFCDDLRPTNMLIDPNTLRITAVLDLEFTNAMPAQFVYDVPWWLLLQRPALWLREHTKEEFLRRFEPRKDQFIRAMERVEAKTSSPAGEVSLSSRMRDSWDSGRFWFNNASRCSFDVDDFYWHCLHREGLGEAILDVTMKDKEAFIARKMRQADNFWEEKESDVRFDEE